MVRFVADRNIPMAVVLAGGLGTRIRTVLPHLPKSLAPVGGRPFLEWVLRYLRAQGVRRVALSTGYLADRINDFLKNLTIPDLDILCVPEPRPLGTAGALIHTLSTLHNFTDTVLVCNGDSLAMGDLTPLLRSLSDLGDGAAMLGIQVDDARHYGTLDVDSAGNLVRFAEKTPGAGLVNAGIYALRRRIIEELPDTIPLSFEYDVFPSLLNRGVPIRVTRSNAAFIDIGREESLAQADAFVERHREWFQ